MPAKKGKSDQSKLFRPPVVAILGHVDHGKTSLLSVIKDIDLTTKEHGGITQHITAYQINFKGEKITFIDTPGHAAFIKMRSHGASVTDLAVLVIAADDGIKPQTKESLSHIRQAKIPFLVAINKIDLVNASVDKVKAQLAENNVLVEGYGGNIVCVEVSAKQKKGLENLLEMILLLAKMEDLKTDVKKLLEAVVIDSRLDSKKGPVATILVKNGILKIGDKVFAKDTEVRIKAMFDDKGKAVVAAGISQPVEVLGFKKVPLVGVKLAALKTLKQASVGLQASGKKKIKTKTEDEKKEEKVKIILKTDTEGTLQAVESNLSEEVEIILRGVGQVNESDVLLALSTKAYIIAFNVKTPAAVKKLAEIEKVKIKTYNVIYKLLEDIEKRVLKILEPTIDETVLGEAKIIAEFKIKKNHIAGCKINKGKISKKDLIHLKRENEIIKDARIISLQKEKKEVSDAKAGEEIGITFSPDLDFKIGDDIISYNK